MPVDVPQTRVLDDDGIGTGVMINEDKEDSLNSRSSLSPVCTAANASAETGGKDDEAEEEEDDPKFTGFEHGGGS